MSDLLKFALAGILGLMAAGANWMWVSSQAKPRTFVAARTALEPGRTISEDDLTAVGVPGDFARLKKSLIPYANRALLFGASATRPYAAGDMFFQRDIQSPDEDTRWDVIGPFRLISVGARFKAPNDETEAYATDSSRNNVTIEVSADFDEQTRRLLEVISPREEGQAIGGLDRRITAVQVLPSRQRVTTDPQSAFSGDNTVYQTVSLEGIANVPRVLLAGDMIRFVIPAPPEY